VTFFRARVNITPSPKDADVGQAALPVQEPLRHHLGLFAPTALAWGLIGGSASAAVVVGRALSQLDLKRSQADDAECVAAEQAIA
jgi:hypothetical protein